MCDVGVEVEAVVVSCREAWWQGRWRWRSGGAAWKAAKVFASAATASAAAALDGAQPLSAAGTAVGGHYHDRGGGVERHRRRPPSAWRGGDGTSPRFSSPYVRAGRGGGAGCGAPGRVARCGSTRGGRRPDGMDDRR